MRHANPLAGWNPPSRTRTVVEANLSAVQREPQEQARAVLECDGWTEHHVARTHPVQRRSLALPQLRLVGDRR